MAVVDSTCAIELHGSSFMLIVIVESWSSEVHLCYACSCEYVVGEGRGRHTALCVQVLRKIYVVPTLKCQP